MILSKAPTTPLKCPEGVEVQGDFETDGLDFDIAVSPPVSNPSSLWKGSSSPVPDLCAGGEIRITPICGELDVVRVMRVSLYVESFDQGVVTFKFKTSNGDIQRQEKMTPVQGSDRVPVDLPLVPFSGNDIAEIVIELSLPTGGCFKANEVFVEACCDQGGQSPSPTPTPSPSPTPISVCPRGYEPITMTYNTIPDDFTIFGLGPFGSSDPFGQPEIDVKDAVLGSGTSITITAKDKIIVKPSCTKALVQEVSFKISGAKSGRVYYVSSTGVVVFEKEFFPSNPSVAEEIVIDDEISDVAQVVFEFNGEEGIKVWELSLTACCPSEATPTPTPTPIATTTSISGFPITMTVDTIPDDFTIFGLGPFGSSDPFGEPEIDVKDAVLGSGTSITITAKDSIIIKPSCTKAIVKEVSFNIRGARSVKIVYVSQTGAVVFEKEFFPSNPSVAEDIFIDDEISGVSQVVIDFDGEEGIEVSGLTVTAYCPSEPLPTPKITTIRVSTTEFIIASTAPGVGCVFDMNTYIEQFQETPDSEEPVGWIEKDNIPGQSDGDDLVFIDDHIDTGVIVHVGCNNCTCDEQGITCTNVKCAVDCVIKKWSEWSDCSKTCDGGIQRRARTVIPPRNGGKRCRGRFIDVRFCGENNCPIDCEWSIWGEWSSCSVTCGSGVNLRTRQVQVDAEYGGVECEDESLEERGCNITCPCPNGKQLVERCICKRTCNNLAFPDSCIPPDECEMSCECPEGEYDDGSGNCVKASGCPCLETESGVIYEAGQTFVTPDQCEKCVCEKGAIICQQLPNCDCKWASWGAWSECNQTCGGGLRRHIREIKSQARGSGEPCEEDSSEFGSCNEEPCQVCDVGGVEYDIGEEIPSDNECQRCFCNDDLEQVCENVNLNGDIEVCVTFECVDGVKIIEDQTEDCTCPPGWILAPTLDDCCACQPPEDECKLTTLSQILQVVDENHMTCQSTSPVVLTYCNGSCPSTDSFSVSIVRPDGMRILIKDREYECKCCVGKGDPFEVNVECGSDKTTRTLEIMQFTSCGCESCTGQSRKKRDLN